jgi:hypothetical protein
MRDRPRVSLVGLAGRLRSATVSVEELGARFDLAPDRTREKTGVTELRRFGACQSPIEMVRELALTIPPRAGADRRDVLGVFGSSNPTADDLLPTFTASAARAIGLERVLVDHVGVGTSIAASSRPPRPDPEPPAIAATFREPVIVRHVDECDDYDLMHEGTSLPDQVRCSVAAVQVRSRGRLDDQSLGGTVAHVAGMPFSRMSLSACSVQAAGALPPSTWLAIQSAA